jgi:hypothetical protein
MPKKRKSSRRKAATKSCKVVRIKGQGRRRICRDKRGRITSNRKAS